MVLWYYVSPIHLWDYIFLLHLWIERVRNIVVTSLLVVDASMLVKDPEMTALIFDSEKMKT